MVPGDSVAIDGVIGLDNVEIDGVVGLGNIIKGETIGSVIRLRQNYVIEPLDVTKNGMYEVPEGTNGFNPVTVGIPEYDGTYTVEPSAEEQILATAGKVMTEDVVISKITSGIRLYASKKVETYAYYDTFDKFKQAMFPDLPTDKDFVMIDFVNNTSNNRAGVYWIQARSLKKDGVVQGGKRVGGQFGGSYGCNVYAGATINVYVGDY